MAGDIQLVVEGLEAGYGRIQILRGVSFSVRRGGLVALLGGNGTGKSTVLKALAGLVRPTAGTILLDGVPVQGLPAHRLAARGLVLVPQGKDVFARMSVAENILMGAYHRRRDRRAVRSDLEEMLRSFPRLDERRDSPAGLLSGGERQMLAIARGLMARPRLLLLDEPSAALSPRLVGAIGEVLRQLPRHGMTVLLVEQNAAFARDLAEEVHVLREGRVALTRRAADLDDAAMRALYLEG
jgi:branched-chain amino acid transport system ATP-binding protein